MAKIDLVGVGIGVVLILLTLIPPYIQGVFLVPAGLLTILSSVGYKGAGIASLEKLGNR
jgi:hypothetical protein